MRICCCRKLFLFDRRYTAKNYWPSKIYTQDIIGQDYWSRYHRSLVASRSWRHSVCMDTYTVLITTCLVTSTLYANGTVTRQSLHVHQWCSCLDIYGTMVVINNTSSIVVTLRDWLHRKRLLAKVIFFYIWCCYSIVAYVHLRNLSPKNCRKVPSLFFPRNDRLSDVADTRSTNTQHKSAKFAKTCYTATTCPQHGGTWRITNK